ncbi:hypothetical protein N658DRAFT_505776 [Parathielavia hyrcaniae]|uniref:Uncharacterized protein n=1 Tax=Parathielavia hyrcaniae TaxID=113614 RepID=A0AAN6T3J1_9PEZI|nr:hypothetical protein N658DRAFT_505776 [Parathielavia hyrcaniae]
MSPLRASRHQWEKFEMDTGKEVVVCNTDYAVDETEDADDEASSTTSHGPCNTTDVSRLRRRATGIFGSRRDRNREPVTQDAEAASPTASPLRQWFVKGNIFAIKPSRTVLRKRSNRGSAAALASDSDRPRTLRVLRVLHATGPNPDSSESSASSHVPSSAVDPNTFFSNDFLAELSGETCAARPFQESFGDTTWASWPVRGAQLPDQETNDLAVRHGVFRADCVPRRLGGNQPLNQQQMPEGAGPSPTVTEPSVGELRKQPFFGHP